MYRKAQQLTLTHDFSSDEHSAGWTWWLHLDPTLNPQQNVNFTDAHPRKS